MTEDEYNKFLDNNFSCTIEKYRDRYDEIAEDKCDQIARIYSKRLPNKCPILNRIYNWFGRAFWIFIILIVILSLLLVFLLPMPSEKVIPDSAANIFTAFIALLGLLAVFFVFKTESQRDRSGNGINTMVDLFEKGHRKKEVKSKQVKSTTKEMIRFFQGYMQEKEELKEKLWKSWIYTSISEQS